MFRLVAVVACATLIATPAIAQSAGEIIVAGNAEVETAAQWAQVGMQLRGEGKTPVDALRALTDGQKTVEDRLQRLAGAKSVTIITGNLAVLPVKADDCEGEDYQPKPRIEQGECAIQGYVATLQLGAKIRPAERAGDAVSLAAEFGGRNATLLGFGIDSPESLRERAAKAAVEDARAQATTIARASGRALGPIIKIQSGGGFDDDEAVAATDAAAAARPTDRPAAPSVSVKLTVPPVSDSARVVVAFRLEP